MASKKRVDVLSRVIADVEAVARRLRADIRKRVVATGVPKRLEAAAKQLRKRAAMAAGQVEKYVHEIRMEIEPGAKKVAKRTKVKRRKKPAPPAPSPIAGL